MNPVDAIDFGREAIMVSLTVVAPILIVAVAAAIAIGIFQSATQMQDQSISFIPRIVLVAITIMICLPWMADHFVEYGRELFSKPHFVNLPAQQWDSKNKSFERQPSNKQLAR